MYREYEPPTTDAVRCVWTSTKVGTQRVVPDGCMDIVWNGTDLLVAGPDTQAFITESSGTGVGVRFQPGVAPGLLGVPAHAIANTRVPLADLWPHDRVQRLLDDVHHGKPGQALLAAVRSAEPDEFAARVLRLAAQGQVRGMADDLGITERHLHRKCLARFGYGPKTLQRILRFSDALELVYAGKPFAEVAYEIGYADQAHLSREVKALAGATLTTLVQDADVTR
nr:Transcriptional regulator, AraC family [Kibdelosporangium sp. MJ126-NF4]CTQ89922.1 Transcriptional regulator, AraC family [Kibdelosporangium sp. MJ126-NF4]